MHQSIVVFEYITSGAPVYILFQTLWSCDNLFTLVVLVPMLYQSLQYLSMSPPNQMYTVAAHFKSLKWLYAWKKEMSRSFSLIISGCNTER